MLQNFATFPHYSPRKGGGRKIVLINIDQRSTTKTLKKIYQTFSPINSTVRSISRLLARVWKYSPIRSNWTGCSRIKRNFFAHRGAKVFPKQHSCTQAKRINSLAMMREQNRLCNGERQREKGKEKKGKSKKKEERELHKNVQISTSFQPLWFLANRHSSNPRTREERAVVSEITVNSWNAYVSLVSREILFISLHTRACVCSLFPRRASDKFAARSRDSFSDANEIVRA